MDETMQNGSFIFYQSFYDAAKCLQERDRADFYGAICEYAFTGEIPDNISDTARAVFCVVKPILDSNAKKRQDGKKGGRPPKKSAVKKPVVSEVSENAEPNVNVNDNVNGNVNVNVNDNEGGFDKQNQSGDYAAVTTSFTERLGGKPPKELMGYVGKLGASRVLELIHRCGKAKGPKWPYLKQCLDNELEQVYALKKSEAGGDRAGQGQYAQMRLQEPDDLALIARMMERRAQAAQA